MWLSIAATLAIWVLTLWLMHRVRWHDVPIITAFLYGWGALLEQPPKNPSVIISGQVTNIWHIFMCFKASLFVLRPDCTLPVPIQVLVGWWLVFCLVVSTGFRSSLVAHLTVQGTTEPIETLQELVSANGWRWAVEPWLMNGILREYFSKNNDPVVKQVYEKAEVSNRILYIFSYIARNYML